jgi:hypothetical protein
MRIVIGEPTCENDVPDINDGADVSQESFKVASLGPTPRESRRTNGDVRKSRCRLYWRLEIDGEAKYRLD